MRTLLARLLRHGPAHAADDRWDDHGLEDIATLVAELAKADDLASEGTAAARSRAVVLGAFASAARDPLATGALPRTRASASAAALDRRGARRAGLVLASAGLLVVAGATTAVAASPGWPLYAARIAVEGIFLPSDPAARAEAQAGRLDERVAEAQRAMNAGDVGAAHAALIAYAQIVDQLADGPLPPAAVRSEIIARIRAELALIEGIDAGNATLAAVAAQVRAAAGNLITAFGGPDGGDGPGPAPADGSAAPSAGPSTPGLPSVGPATTSGPQPAQSGGSETTHPDRSWQPGGGGQPGGTTEPSSPPPSAAPGGSQHGPGPSSGAGPGPTPSPSPDATASTGGPGGGSSSATPSAGQGAPNGASPQPGQSGVGGASASPTQSAGGSSSPGGQDAGGVTSPSAGNG